MRLTIGQSQLAKAISSAGRCVARRSTLAALGAILLDARDNLSLHATDLDRTLCLAVEASVQQPGRTLVPARILTEFVGSLPGGDVELYAADAKTLSIQSGGYHANIRTLDPDDFPSAPVLREPASLTVPAATLKQAIGQVRHAVNEDESRPTLTGVLFRADGTSLTLASADGFRLAVKRIAPLPGQAFEAIVPAAAVDEIARLLADGDASLEVGHAANTGDATHLSLTVEHATFTARLIEGRFPQYDQIIPTVLVDHIECAVSDLRQALRVAAPITREASSIVRLVWDKGGLEVSAEASDTGNVRANVEASYPETPGELALNATYLADALGAITTDRVELAWQGRARPVRIVGVGDETLVQVIMPIHTSGGQP